MDKELLVIAITMIIICFVVVLPAFATMYITGIPTNIYNQEFKESFCETQGFDKYEDETCIKFDNGTVTITELYCEGIGQPGFIIYDRVYEKLTKCRTVI